MNTPKFSLQSFTNGIIFWLGMVSILFILWITHALTGGLSTADKVVSGSWLTATSWNRIIDGVLDLDTRVSKLSFSGSNVGIGTGNPGVKLEVNGTIKSSKLDSAAGEFISISLNQCWGPCASNHALNTWINIGAQNYAWTTGLNTAPDNFVHDGKGTITVTKTGVYHIALQDMYVPTADTGYAEVVCPYINGIANCWYNSTFGYIHWHRPAGWWAQQLHEFTFQLSPGNTVAWWYNPNQALTYWAHDSYTALEISRLQ